MMVRRLMLAAIVLTSFGCQRGGTGGVHLRIHTPTPIGVGPGIIVRRDSFTKEDDDVYGYQRLDVERGVPLMLVREDYHSPPLDVLPRSLLYIGRDKAFSTAIEIHRTGWVWRRVNVRHPEAGPGPDEEQLRKLLRDQPWQRMEELKVVAIRSLLLAWVTNHPPDVFEYRANSSGRIDQFIVLPLGVFGTTGDAASPPGPPEWNVLIHALRELFPSTDATQAEGEAKARPARGPD